MTTNEKINHVVIDPTFWPTIISVISTGVFIGSFLAKLVWFMLFN